MSSSRAAKLNQTRTKLEDSEPLDIRQLWGQPTNLVCTGWIVQVDAQGRALIDFDGNKIGPVLARSVCMGAEKSCGDGRQTVLLVFERGDPTLPIIIGIVRDTLFPSADVRRAPDANEVADTHHTRARVMTFEAGEYLELRCGQASITLTDDGRAEVKGKEIVSKASRTNKIRGASVQIN